MEETAETQENNNMACNCKFYQRRIEKLQKKYTSLRRNHKKLLGVTVLLTEALEQLVRGDGKSEINKTLETCSSIYPDLFAEEKAMGVENSEENKGNQMVDENGKIYDPATESEKEYFEGFLARPKIPRTPQV